MDIQRLADSLSETDRVTILSHLKAQPHISVGMAKSKWNNLPVEKPRYIKTPLSRKPFQVNTPKNFIFYYCSACGDRISSEEQLNEHSWSDHPHHKYFGEVPLIAPVKIYNRAGVLVEVTDKFIGEFTFTYDAIDEIVEEML